MLEMSSLRVMVKRSRGKKLQEETEKQQHVVVTKTIYLKVLLQKVMEITTRSSPASLRVALHGIPLVVEEFLAGRSTSLSTTVALLSSLLDFFWS